MDTNEPTPENPAIPSASEPVIPNPTSIPEAANIEYITPIKYAGLGIRYAALLLDSFCLLPLLGLALYNNITLKYIFLAMVIPVITLLYRIILEYKYGATIGKVICNIYVVNIQYQSINIQEAIMRNSFNIITTLFSMISAYLIFTSEGFDDVTSYSDYNKFITQVSFVVLLTVLGSLTSIADAICLLADNKSQSIHDKLGGTYVIKK